MKIQEPANLGLDDLHVSMCIGVDNYSLLVCKVGKRTREELLETL